MHSITGMETGGSDHRSVSRPKVGLALSSGGAKGLAHIGVIQVLEENGFEIDAIAGASMGAYVGSLRAAGLTGKELQDLAAKIVTGWERLNLVDPVFPPTRGFIRARKIERRLRETLGHRTFAQLKIPAFFVAARLEDYTVEVLRSGDVASAVVASLAIPGIVEPVWREGRYYIDGGTCVPLPVSVLKEFADVDRIIAVSVIPTLGEIAKLPSLRAPPNFFRRLTAPFRWVNRRVNVFAEGNLVDIVRGAAMGAQMRLLELSSQEADLYIRAVNPIPSWHDYHHHEAYVEIGRRAAEKALPEIRAVYRQPVVLPV